MHDLIDSQKNPVRIKQAICFSKFLNFRRIVFSPVADRLTDSERLSLASVHTAHNWQRWVGNQGVLNLNLEVFSMAVNCFPVWNGLKRNHGIPSHENL